MSSITPTKQIYSVYIDSSSSNIPTSYGSGATSKILTGAANKGYRHFKCINETGSRIAFCFVADKNASAPSSSNSSNTSQDYLSATSTELKDDLAIFDALYIRSDSGSAISSGVVIVEVW